MSLKCLIKLNNTFSSEFAPSDTKLRPDPPPPYTADNVTSLPHAQEVVTGPQLAVPNTAMIPTNYALPQISTPQGTLYLDESSVGPRSHFPVYRTRVRGMDKRPSSDIFTV